MVVRIERKILEETLSTAAQFAITKTAAIPGLQGGLLEFGKNQLTITATNLNDTFQTNIKTEGDGDGRAVVEIKKIAEFIHLLKEPTILIETEKNILAITGGAARAEFSLLPAEDFPSLNVEKEKKQTIEETFFSQDLPLVVFSAAKDETRPTLTGVRFDVLGQKKCLVATDGFRLSLVFRESMPVVSKTTLSAALLSLASRSLQGQPVALVVSEKNKTIQFLQKNTTIQSRFIEGDYPNFEKVVPQTHTTQAVFLREDFEQAIKVAAVFIKESASTVVFDLKKNKTQVRPRTSASDAAIVTLSPREFSGLEMTIAFNYRFLLEFLANTNSKTITLETTESTNPGVFRIDSHPNFIHIIMPVRLEQ